MALFTGFFLPEKKKSKKDESDCESGHESDSDDDFEDHDFRDMHKIAEETLHCSSSSKLRNVVETMQGLSTTNECRVRGQFDPLFSRPWWRVEIKTNERKSSNTMKLASSRPSYSFRTDDSVGEDILSLFLVNGCKVDPQHATALLDFIRSNNLRPTLVDLLDNLNKFANSTEDYNREMAVQIKTSLRTSATGKAFLVPKLTKYAHRLFPHRACSLFSDPKINLSKLTRMNDALDNEPWAFGYQTVLKNQFHITGFEAKLSAFIECDLLGDMPVEMRDALYIYNALSEVTRSLGHTFVLLRELKQPKYYSKPYSPGTYHVSYWEKSLDYLSRVEVVKTEGDGFNDRCHVFLTHIRGYEETIANNLSKIMRQESWIGSIEIKEEIFGGDQDQVKAAKLLTTKPVVVMSGRGGCGKTFVVSSVLKMKAGYPLADSFSGEEIDSNPLLEDKNKEEETEPSCDVPGPQTSSLNLESSDQSFPSSTTTCHVSDEQMELHQSLLSNCCPADSQENQETHLPQTDPTSHIQDEVLLTAPTGKAAALLGKRTKIPSYTLHSVIFSFFGWLKRKKKSNEVKDEKEVEDDKEEDWKFSEVRLLVCDECSLISVRLFSTLINILSERSKLQQVILLGDIDQLPSIEPGNFLSDVYHALEPHGVSIKLTFNHRSDSEHIVQNAIKISEQQLPEFTNEKGGFVSIRYPSKQTDEDSNTIAERVKSLLNNNLPPPKKSQFVAFRRKDCSLINELCAMHYNKHPIRDSRGRFDFQIGDKVCLRRNTVCFDEYEKEEVKLCNGEIFFIKNIIEEVDNHSKKTTYFVLDDEERTMKIALGMLKKLSHAWARTIHTFQGSEMDTVVYVVGNPFRQNWQHVYTAVTRGVQKVIIINNPKNLETAIKSHPIRRQTKLKDDLNQALRGYPLPTQFCSRSTGGDRSDHTLTSIDQMDALASETPGGSSFSISRNNLRRKKSMEAVQEEKMETSFGSTDRSSSEISHRPSSPVMEAVGIAVFNDEAAFKSPQKRKLLESSALLSPPETPKSFKHLGVSLLSVSPLNQNPSENKHAGTSRQSALKPTKKNAIPAKFPSRCQVCKILINIGDEIAPLEEMDGRGHGFKKMWVHSKCTKK